MGKEPYHGPNAVAKEEGDAFLGSIPLSGRLIQSSLTYQSSSDCSLNDIYADRVGGMASRQVADQPGRGGTRVQVVYAG